MKKTLTVILSAILTGVLSALLVFECAVFIKKDETVPEPTSASSELSVDGCYVTSMFSYTGEYPEDGSFENVENVAAITVKNNSSIDIEQAEIKVTTDAGEYTFLAVSWMAGGEMTVLDENRTPLEEDFRFKDAQIVSISAYESKPGLLPELLSVSTSGGIVRVKNVSEKNIEGNVKIYLKLTGANGYFGGTSFFVRFDGIPAGEEGVLDTGILSEHKLVPVFAETENENAANGD